MARPSEIDVWQGEIAELEVDALVVPANESLFMTAGAAASVKRHGGERIERAAVDQGPVHPGEVVVTDAGSLAATYVIHAVGVGHDRVADPVRLRATIRRALDLAAPLDVRRMAFALIGVEHGAFTAPEAASILLDELTTEEASAGPLDTVVIATIHPSETRAVAEALGARQARVT